LVTGLWQRRGIDLVSIAEEDVAALRLGGIERQAVGRQKP